MSNKQITKRIYTGAMDEGTYRLARTEVTTEECLDCADEIGRLCQRIEELESIVIDSSVGMMQAEDTAGKKYCRLQKRIKEQKERLDEEERKKAQQKIDILTGKRISEEE